MASADLLAQIMGAVYGDAEAVDPDEVASITQAVSDALTAAALPDPDALGLLTLTADYPVEHPLRQAAARLTTRLALAEGKIATAVALIDPEAPAWDGSLEAKLLEILKR